MGGGKEKVGTLESFASAALEVRGKGHFMDIAEAGVAIGVGDHAGHQVRRHEDAGGVVDHEKESVPVFAPGQAAPRFRGTRRRRESEPASFGPAGSLTRKLERAP